MRRIIAALALSLMVCALTAAPALAAAAGPSTEGATVLSEGFESASTSCVTTTTHAETYWGRVAERSHSGGWGLWCAGTGPTAWGASSWSHLGGKYQGAVEDSEGRVLAYGTEGDAIIELPQLSEYYSSTLDFWYTMPSKAGNDLFQVRWAEGSVANQDRHVESLSQLTGDSAWVRGSYSLSGADPDYSLSGRSGYVLFYWLTQDYTLSPTNAEGATIDDLRVTGFKYGPVRGLQQALDGSDVVLTWSKPYRAVYSSEVDTRAVSYRVWRRDPAAAGGVGEWTELTAAGRVSDVPSPSYRDSGGIPGHLYEYYVQTWDPGSSVSGWGEVAPFVRAVAGSRVTSLNATFWDGSSESSVTPDGAVLKVTVLNAEGAPVPGLGAAAFRVCVSASPSFAASSAVTPTSVTEVPAASGVYRIAVPISAESYYAVGFVGGELYDPSGLEPLPGGLHASVDGAMTLATDSGTAVVAYNGVARVTAVLRDRSGAGVSGCAARMRLRYYDGVAWQSLTAAVTDLGGGAYSATTPGTTELRRYQLHCDGTGANGWSDSADSGSLAVLPKAYLSAPSGKSSARKGKAYTMTGTLKPGHGGRPVRVEGYQKVKGKWKKRWTKSAGGVDRGSYAQYTLKVKLAKGSWRFRAVHSDASHAATYTGYKSVSCR